MEALFLYLVKSIIWLFVFGAIYFFFLRKESYFLFNRIFLLVGLAASFLFPLLQYSYIVEIQPPSWTQLLARASVADAVAEVSAPRYTVGDGLLLLYILGIVGAASYVFRGVFRIMQWSRQGERMKLGNREVIKSSAKQGSFTFLNRIFINDSYIDSEREKELILLHEEAHVRQLHWVDLLLGQVLVIVQWFNPMAYLYLRFVKDNQEYLADEAVLKQNTPQIVYQAALINSTLKLPVFNITNSFSSNHLNRIKMMKTRSKSKLKAFAVLLVIPALACFLWAFAEPEYVYAQTQPGVDKPIVIEEDIEITETITSEKDEEGQTKKVITIKMDRESDGETPVVQNVKVVGAEGKTTTVVVRGTSKDSDPLIIVDGEELTSGSLDDIDVKAIKHVNVLKDESAIKVYGEKGKNGVVIVNTKNGESNITFLENSLTLNGKSVQSKTVTADKDKIYAKDLRLIIDGEEVSPEMLKEIESANEKTITILKNGDPQAVSLSADTITMSGKPIKVTTCTTTTISKSVSSDEENAVQTFYYTPKTTTKRTTVSQNSPLFIFDGQEISAEEMTKLVENNIETIEVLKDSSATEKYGEKGKNGVIEITSKKASSK